MSLKASILTLWICMLVFQVVESQTSCPPTFLSYRRYKFSSPEYPREYPNNTRCSYNIIAPEFHFIMITFHDFQLYDENDYVEIVEKYEENWAKRSKRGISISSILGNGTAVQIQRPDSPEANSTQTNYAAWIDASREVIRKEIRGPMKTPFRYATERSVVGINFVSDGTFSAKGFNATYSIHRYSKRCNKKVMTEDEGTFINHRSPADFPANTKCDYVIRAREGTFVELKFAPSLPFNFYDRIEIGTGVGEKRLHHQTDALAFKLNFTSNLVSIRYMSDRRTLGGFTISYRAFDEEELCKAKDMKGNEGTFHSPGYPSLYPYNVECEYTIEVEKDHHIEIVFHLFHLSTDGENRTGDYLGITDIGAGNDVDKAVYNRSRYAPLKYVSQSNVVGLRFVSDSAKLWKERGFSASYRAIKNIRCGSDVFVVTCGKFNCTYSPSGEAESCKVECDENYKIVGKRNINCKKASTDDVPKCILHPEKFRICLRNMRNPLCPHSYERVADYFTDPDEEGRIDFPRDEVYTSKADLNSKAFINYIRRAMENKKENCENRLCALNTTTKTHIVNCKRYARAKLTLRQYKKSTANMMAENKHLRHCLKCQYLNCRARG